MILIATEDGVYDLSGKRRCCKGKEVYDLLEDYFCAWEGVYKLPTEEKIEGRSCWRLVKAEDRIYASIEGPVLLDLHRGREIDLSRFAKELGWHFPHGPPHITDVTRFKEEWIVAVEVGHMLAGPSLEEPKPLGFKHDQHNLLPHGRFLLVATAAGIYYTADLSNFAFAEGSAGYAHALLYCRGRLYSHVMKNTPIIESADGRQWRNLDIIKLPPPTFGTTALGCYNAELIYSTTSTYVIRDGDRDVILKGHPMTKRVIVEGSKFL